MRKSHIISLILTFIFGPLGLFYSTIGGAIALTILAIAIGSITLGIGALFLWPVAMIVGFFAVNRHNRRANLDDRRHEELVQATREGTSNPQNKNLPR